MLIGGLPTGSAIVWKMMLCVYEVALHVVIIYYDFLLLLLLHFFFFFCFFFFVTPN
jgi:hypothetical protein